jgi:hypothetical protein
MLAISSSIDGDQPLEDHTALQLISKLLVLAISDIRELNVGSVTQRALSSQFVAAFVLPHVIEPQRQRQADCDGASHDDRNLGWDVIRRALCCESERAHDVAQTE